MPNIGVPELLIVLAILLLIFGPKRLPGLGRQLGSGMREFKDSITGRGSEDDDEEQGATVRPAVGSGAPSASEPVPPAVAAEPERDPAAPPRG